jgi:hypothetical protein
VIADLAHGKGAIASGNDRSSGRPYGAAITDCSSSTIVLVLFPSKTAVVRYPLGIGRLTGHFRGHILIARRTCSRSLIVPREEAAWHPFHTR